MLPRVHKLTASRDFRRVQSRGRRWSGRYVAVRAAPSGGNPSRFGVSVSERVGKAVVRNRVKRRLREAIRAAIAMATGQVDSGWDIVVNAREAAASASFAELAAEVVGGIGNMVSPVEADAQR